MNPRILLKNIQLPDGRTNDILIENGIISGIRPCGELQSWPGTEVVYCNHLVAMPGFINMHTHAAMALMRGMEEDVIFQDWLNRIWEIEAKIDEKYVYAGSKVAALEMIRTGTTSFNDHYWFARQGHRAAEEMGIHPVISYVIIDKNDPEEAARQKDECQRMYEDSRQWKDDSIFAVAFHAIYSVSEEMIRWASEFARAHGLLLHFHLSETEKEVIDCRNAHGGLSPVEYLDELGVLGPEAIAAHTLWISDNDVRILGERKVNCVHNINSNLKLASGYRFRYNELRDAGANVCIGTDGCASSNNMDILEACKTAAIVQKAWRNDPKAWPLEELIACATAHGAKALGIHAGVLEEGARADILLVDTDNSFFLSPGSFLANFIYSAHSDCIRSVIAGGKFVMRDRVIPAEATILEEGRKVLEEII